MAEMMVIWEGRVPAERQSALLAAYREGSHATPPQMTRHWITRDLEDPEVLRLVSFWESRAALEDYRRHAETPAALLMFRAAGVEPTRTISESLDP